MQDTTAEDLKKYEAEIGAINAKLAELDENRARLIKHGTRIEGIVAYLRAKSEEAAKTSKDGVIVEESAA